MITSLLSVFVFALCCVTFTGCVDKPSSVGESQSYSDKLAMFNAAVKGSVDDVRHFIEQGGNINATDGSQTLLHRAAAHNRNIDVLKYLIEEGIDVNVKDNGGKTPLHMAAKSNRNYNVAIFLIKQGADVNAQDNKGDTPLDYILDSDAVSHNHIQEILIKAGGKSGRNYQSPFANIYQAAADGSVDDVMFFLAKGKDANPIDRNRHGETPLHLAVKNSRVEVVKYLIEKGADVNAKGIEDRTPLHMAVSGLNSNVDVVKLLIGRGANVNAKDFYGETPLHYAAFSTSNVDVIKILIEQGANINARGICDETPLHRVMSSDNSIEVLKCLIEKGADVNSKSNRGLTPLDGGMGVTPHFPEGDEGDKRQSKLEMIIDEKKSILRAAGVKHVENQVISGAGGIPSEKQPQTF